MLDVGGVWVVDGSRRVAGWWLKNTTIGAKGGYWPCVERRRREERESLEEEGSLEDISCKPLKTL